MDELESTIADLEARIARHADFDDGSLLVYVAQALVMLLKHVKMLEAQR